MPDAQDEPRTTRPPGPGTITRMAAQQRNPERVSVFLDGAFAFGVHSDLVVRYGLHKGQVLGVEEQQRIVEADRVRSAGQAALDYLGYRARTEQEVRRKLQRKGFDEAVAERAIERLRELDYLDDAAYARSYVKARFRNKGYGPVRLRADLRRRGVAARIIDAVLDEHLERDDLLEAAREHAARRWGRLAREDDPFKRRKKLSDYLRRRGFSYDTTRRVIDELEAEEGTP